MLSADFSVWSSELVPTRSLVSCCDDATTNTPFERKREPLNRFDNTLLSLVAVKDIVQCATI